MRSRSCECGNIFSACAPFIGTIHSGISSGVIRRTARPLATTKELQPPGAPHHNLCFPQIFTGHAPPQPIALTIQDMSF